MNRSMLFVGTLLIVVATLAGGLVSVGLYRWEQAARASTDGQMPAPPPTAVPPTATPSMSSQAATPVATGAPLTSVFVTPTATGPMAASASDATGGQTVYAQLCDACHPGGGKGFGPALNSPDFEAKYGDDAALAAIIREGTTAMPGFPTSRVSDEQLGGLIAFIRSLGGVTAQATPTEVPVFGQLTWTGSYARDIQPIFDEYCVRCHSETLAENGLRLDTYQGVMQGTRGGAVVMPGIASGSTLVWVVEGLAAPEIRMPHADHPLSPNRIQNIILWIDAGAPNN